MLILRLPVVPGLNHIYIGEGIIGEEFEAPNSTAGTLGPGIEVSPSGMFIETRAGLDYVIVDVHTGAPPPTERLIFTGTMHLASLGISPPDIDVQPLLDFLHPADRKISVTVDADGHLYIRRVSVYLPEFSDPRLPDDL